MAAPSRHLYKSFLDLLLHYPRLHIVPQEYFQTNLEPKEWHH